LAPNQQERVSERETTAAFGLVDARQRQVFFFVGVIGLSRQEASDAIHCIVGTVKSRLWRARTRLIVLPPDNNGEKPAGLARQRPDGIDPFDQAWFANLASFALFFGDH